MVLARNRVAILRRTISEYQKYLELTSLLQPKRRLLAIKSVAYYSDFWYLISQMKVKLQPCIWFLEK